MRTHKVQLMTSIFALMLLLAATVSGQENQYPPQKELQGFLDQFLPAFQEGNTRKTAQLVRENRKLAWIVAMLLNNQGMKALGTANYDTALKRFMISLEIYQILGEHEAVGITLNNIGGLYWSIGEYQRALAYYREALTIHREMKYPEGEGTSLHNIGSIYGDIGEYQQALTYFQKALTLQKESGNHARVGAILHNMGVIYEATGEYQQALAYYQNALTVSRTIEDRAGEAKTLHDIGAIYYATGDIRQAFTYYQEALTIQRELGDRANEGVTLHSIGVIYREMGAYQHSIAYLQDALAIHRAIGDRVEEGTTLYGLGATYYANGSYQQALAYYHEALNIHRAIGNRASEGKTLNSIGVLYHSIGKYQQALAYYQEALALHKVIGNLTGKGVTLANIGNLYEQQKQWKKAVEYDSRAIALLEAIRSKAGGNEAREGLLEKQISVYRHIVKLLFQLNAPEEAFAYTERSKAQSFLEQLYEASIRVKHGVDQQLLMEETHLYDKLFVIEQNLRKAPNNQNREQLLKERHSLEYELSVLQMTLRTSDPRYAELKYPQPVTVEQVQREILKEGEVLVEYLQGEVGFYVFIIGKTTFYTRFLPRNKQTAFRITELMNNSVAYNLSNLLFQPLEQTIVEANQGKKLKTLIIIPDETLFYLPFEMLVTKEEDPPEYLIDRYPIVYAPSASVLKPEILHARKPEQYAQDLLALAPFGEEGTETTTVALRSTENLLLSDTLRSGLEGVQPLPYSAGEVQTISSLYPQSVCKIGEDATKAYFRDHAKGNRYLHLSTHGYLDNEHAMYSGLLFSDGMLQTYEIFNMDIDAELTVLSACETGLGELKAGEGLVGLTRAFMYAGSPSVLVSLWPVSDPSTAAFMKRFYRNLNRGMTKAEALRETKVWMKTKSYHTDEHGNVIKHNDPFYWAPFILVGAHE